MTTARLRKAFKYPNESEDSDASQDALDEEEQERLIANFRAKEDSDNYQYRLVFSLLPLSVIFPFLYYLFSSRRMTSLLCIIAITSLLSTAYTMWSIPDEPPQAVGRFPLAHGSEGPVQKYLPYLNSLASGLLALSSVSLRTKEGIPGGLWLFMLLPGVMLLMITIARKSMNDIQSSIGELSEMRYGYKGA